MDFKHFKQREAEIISVLETLTNCPQVGLGPDGIAGDTRKEIIIHLDSAVILGMHRVDDTLEVKPGVDVHVGKYITYLCGQYGVKIPNKR